MILGYLIFCLITLAFGTYGISNAKRSYGALAWGFFMMSSITASGLWLLIITFQVML